MQPVGYGLVEGSFLLDCPPRIQGDLDEDAVIGAADAEISRVEDEILRLMLGDDLEAVILRHVDGAAHGVIDHVADALAIVGGLSFDQVDADERHGISYLSMRLMWGSRWLLSSAIVMARIVP